MQPTKLGELTTHCSSQMQKLLTAEGSVILPNMRSHLSKVMIEIIQDEIDGLIKATSYEQED